MANKWTGERLETFVYNETTIEHLHRYAIAMEFADKKNVLDIACGEGYGSNLLASVASHVTGVDINNQTIENAKNKYKKENLRFLTGDIYSIPLMNNSIDIIITYETIEHVENHHQLMQEIKRVLKKDGIVLLSTPNKKEYSDKRNYQNPFHKKELYKNEFEDLLYKYFKFVKIAGQQILLASYISTNDSNLLNYYTGSFINIQKIETPEPLYYFAILSDIPILHVNSSLFIGNSIFEKGLLEREDLVKKTISYKLGHYILYPLKYIQKAFGR